VTSNLNVDPAKPAPRVAILAVNGFSLAECFSDVAVGGRMSSTNGLFTAEQKEIFLMEV